MVSPNPSLTIQTDASLTGYGAVLLETGHCLKGSWDSIDLPSFPSVLPIPPDSVVRLQSDNATAVAYLKNFSGRVPALHVLARSILELSLNKKITLLPVHIPGSINSTADRLRLSTSSSPTSPRAIETWWSQIAKLEERGKCSAP